MPGPPKARVLFSASEQFSSDRVKRSDKNLVDGLQSSGRFGTDVEFIKVEAAFGWCMGAGCGSRMLVAWMKDLRPAEECW